MLDVAPDLREILAGFSWHLEAACRGEPDERTFFPEEPKDVTQQKSRMDGLRGAPAPAALLRAVSGSINV